MAAQTLNPLLQLLDFAASLAIGAFLVEGLHLAGPVVGPRLISVVVHLLEELLLAELVFQLDYRIGLQWVDVQAAFAIGPLVVEAASAVVVLNLLSARLQRALDVSLVADERGASLRGLDCCLLPLEQVFGRHLRIVAPLLGCIFNGPVLRFATPPGVKDPAEV